LQDRVFLIFKMHSVAVECMLNIFAGPPGTGKTYVGLRIIQTFLKNLFDRTLQHGFMEDVETCGEVEHILPKQLKTPILVVCYTNHALDQFLEGILEFHPSCGNKKAHYPTLNLASLALNYKKQCFIFAFIDFLSLCIIYVFLCADNL